MSTFDVTQAGDDIKALLWVFGVMQELSNLGMVEGSGEFYLAPKGVAAFDQILQDFTPTNHQILVVASMLGPTDTLESLVTIIEMMYDYCDDKEAFLKNVQEFIKDFDQDAHDTEE